MKKFFISAGEPSGDAHAARLIRAMKLLDSDIQFIGIGGPRMAEAGMNSLLPQSEMSVVGVWEVAKKLNFFLNALKQCKSILNSEKIDAFIPVDYPGFNLKLASIAKKSNIPVIYYIAPQLWIWGNNRASKLEKNVDLLLTVFPFEKDFFRQYGINTEFVGHPLLEQIGLQKQFPDYKSREKTIAIFPGSRIQEIHNHQILINATINLLTKQLPDYKIEISCAESIPQETYSLLAKHQNVDLSYDSYELMARAKAGIIKTGTSNLEAALCGLPITMFYKTSNVTYWIGKLLVKSDYISIVNILQKRSVINEFIQHDAQPELIVDDIVDLVNNQDRFSSIQTSYLEIRQMLGERGASENAASAILNFIK